MSDSAPLTPQTPPPPLPQVPPDEFGEKRSRRSKIILIGSCMAIFAGLLLFAHFSSTHATDQELGDNPENVTIPPAGLIPEEDHSLMEQAMALIIDGKMAEAEAVFKPKLTSSPYSADVHCYKAAVLAHDGKTDEAIAEFNNAIFLNPRFEIAYNDRGNEYDKLHDWNHAIADYTRATLCGFRAVHWSNRANVYVKTRHYQKAVDDTTEAINRYNVNPFAFYVRAEAYEGLRQHNPALADINHALQLAPNDISYLICRGQIYFADSQPELAQADFTKAISLKNDCADAYFWRGRSERPLAQYDKARADFTMYKRLRPDDKVVDGWLADLPQYEYDFAHKPATEARQWAIACTAQMFSKNYEGIYSLPGQIPTEENIAREKRLLHNSWHIDNHATLLVQLDSLMNHGHNSEWQMYRKLLQRQSRVEIFRTSKKAEYAIVNRRLAVVREYGETFGERGLHAWDLVRYICLCRWGAKVGYLTEDEAYALMMPAARKLQNTYDSWKQMSSEYLVGRKFWDESIWAKDKDRLDDITKLLLTCKASPWVYLPWNTNLER